MSYVAKCSLCNRTFPYRKSDTSALIRHMIKHHPKHSIIEPVKQHMQLENSSSVNSSNEDFKSDPRLRKRKALIRKLRTNYGEAADENLPDRRDFTARRPTGKYRMYYKTTVATWKPARARKTCSSCGETHFPVIRSTADKYSRSVLGATTIMSCWPFCFLPCLFTAPTKHHLHCSSCGAYLGPYDESREVFAASANAPTHHRRRRKQPSHRGG
ncbi:uncharacterized protein LOC128740661 [Sabethes cyaneus]|uniref:uncharacterized protein LOC128740661 n=1 Tax=Sabethes cyaneus TaxID=53552 RepID=UPI00237DA32E|nr:uncharacterized protein LOC128740661 [Sabethes cyaneus]